MSVSCQFCYDPQPRRYRRRNPRFCVVSRLAIRPLPWPYGCVWCPHSRENRESGDNPERAQRCDGDGLRRMPLGDFPGRRARPDDPKSEDRPDLMALPRMDSAAGCYGLLGIKQCRRHLRWRLPPAFSASERDAVYKAIFTRRDVRDQFLPEAGSRRRGAASIGSRPSRAVGGIHAAVELYHHPRSRGAREGLPMPLAAPMTKPPACFPRRGSPPTNP